MRASCTRSISLQCSWLNAPSNRQAKFLSRVSMLLLLCLLLPRYCYYCCSFRYYSRCCSHVNTITSPCIMLCGHISGTTRAQYKIYCPGEQFGINCPDARILSRGKILAYTASHASVTITFQGQKKMEGIGTGLCSQPYQRLLWYSVFAFLLLTW